VIPAAIASAGVVVLGSFYQGWGKWGYMNYCVACALPYIVWPLLFPAAADKARSRRLRVRMRAAPHRLARCRAHRGTRATS
jgi:cycloeucalenol cycloisomerase